MTRQFIIKIWVLCLVSSHLSMAALELDESPGQPGEWGYRPREGEVLGINPPSFVWRPQMGLHWELVCSSDVAFMQNAQVVYRAQDLEWNVCCPSETLAPGTYHWRYRGRDQEGRNTSWSKVRSFTIPPDTPTMPMPTRQNIMGRIPKTHPRLFLRPEKVHELKQLAQGSLKNQYDALVSSCERLLRNPASIKEPPTYPKDMERKSEAWRKMWWGNRVRVQEALGSAATLGFTWRIGGDSRYGQEARRLLMACAHWNPKGSTGYRYNDEAGMPYNYYFSRTYTFVYDLLTEEEREHCRYVMKIRGDEMYAHLCPRHLWRPYSSHSNRAWHFLGEIALAFHGEIQGTEDWLWFAMNVFYNVYPVWSDDDGGWHEGASYWSSYQNRFTWWADILREVLDINAYDKPYYSKIGDYALYLMPPGKVGGGFGDLTARRTSTHNRQLLTVVASQAQNPYWRWYVDQLGGPDSAGGYIGFVRGALPTVTPKSPDDLPTSRLFQGTGQAVLNSQIVDARKSVQVVFKSSPFGTQSHGYEANNSFLLWAYGKRLLIRSGYRDIYGSDHHRDWMWSTRSVNNITVNDQGQRRHSPEAQGRITAFYTSPDLDVVSGEAGAAYEMPLERYTRTIVFVKPELVLVYDRLTAPKISTFQYHLHAVNKMELKKGNRILVRNDNVCCKIHFFAPEVLSFHQTDQYDPNPRPRVSLREWHTTASALEPGKDMSFVTLYRVYRQGDRPMHQDTFQETQQGYVLTASVKDGTLTALLPKGPKARVQAEGLDTTGTVLLRLEHEVKPAQVVNVEGLGVN